MSIAHETLFVLDQRHRLGWEGDSDVEVIGLPDFAEAFVDLNRRIENQGRSRRSRTQVNLFFEASARTDSSFDFAGKRHGTDVLNNSVNSSSVGEGETLNDTAITLNAMLSDILIVRHHTSRAVELLARKADCPVINAGDGSHEHPTSALLDAQAIRRQVTETAHPPLVERRSWRERVALV